MSVLATETASGNDIQGFRRILPRSPQDTRSTQSAPPLKAVAPRKKNVLAACESCRKRKCKCDGVRPSCLRCLSGQQECVYFAEPWESQAENLKRKHAELQAEVHRLRESNAAFGTLFEALRSREAHEAGAILQRIREGNGVESILQSMRAGDLLLHLQVYPESKSGPDIEFPGG